VRIWVLTGILDRMRLNVTFCLATLVLAASSVPAAPALETCFRQPPAKWAACLEEFDARDLGSDDFQRLDEQIAEDPETALSFLKLLESTIRRDDPALIDDRELHAELLDRQAEAHRLLGNAERAAELALAALETHSGNRTLSWWSAEGDRLWTVALDTTGRRHERAARAKLEQGQTEEARSLLTAALRLGATGEVESLWSASGGGPVKGLDASPEPIRAAPWFPGLPRVLVPLVEGEPYLLQDALGSVLILDFWASWCEPCLKELPALGELYRAEKDRGLQVLLINVGETEEHALHFARGMGLEMPVGIYDEALEDAFDTVSLPTVIVADRDGRVRARWDQYGEGVEEEVAALARRLMEGEAYEPGELLGQTLRGGPRLHVEWARIAKGGIDGLAVVRPEGPGAPGTLLAVAGRYVLSYDWRGVVTGFVNRPPGSGLLRGGDLTGAGRDEFFSYRRGGTGEPRLALISRERSLCILDPADPEDVRCSGGRWRGVVTGPPGSGMGSVPQGAAAVTGHLLGGQDGEVAVITSSGQLVILDIANGEERYRARLHGPRALAAGDLDGDGVDELALVLEDRVLVMTADANPGSQGGSGSENEEN